MVNKNILEKFLGGCSHCASTTVKTNELQKTLKIPERKKSRSLELTILDAVFYIYGISTIDLANVILEKENSQELRTTAKYLDQNGIAFCCSCAGQLENVYLEHKYMKELSSEESLLSRSLRKTPWSKIKLEVDDVKLEVSDNDIFQPWACDISFKDNGDSELNDGTEQLFSENNNFDLHDLTFDDEIEYNDESSNKGDLVNTSQPKLIDHQLIDAKIVKNDESSTKQPGAVSKLSARRQHRVLNTKQGPVEECIEKFEPRILKKSRNRQDPTKNIRPRGAKDRKQNHRNSFDIAVLQEGNDLRENSNICNKTSGKGLSSKKRERYKKQYICKCGQSFDNRPTYDNHNKKHKKMSCDKCGKAFNGIEKFNKHFEYGNCGDKITEEQEGAFSHCQYSEPPGGMCEDCGQMFMSRSALKLHIRAKHSEATFQCSLCPSKFSWPSSLRMHVDSVHSTSPPDSFICEKCGNSFMSRASLLKHTRHVHRDEGKDKELFKCKKCGLYLKHSYSLRKHMKTMHQENLKLFTCEQCGKTTKNMTNMKIHMRVHDVNRNLKRKPVPKRSAKDKHTSKQLEAEKYNLPVPESEILCQT